MFIPKIKQSFYLFALFTITTILSLTPLIKLSVEAHPDTFPHSVAPVVRITDSYNHQGTGLSIWKNNRQSNEKIVNTRTELKESEERLRVKDDTESWAALVPLFGPNNNIHGGLLFRTIPSKVVNDPPTYSDYAYPCTSNNGHYVLGWNYGDHYRTCGYREGFKFEIEEKQETDLTFDRGNRSIKNFTLAQSNDDSVTVFPNLGETIVWKEDTEDGIQIKVIDGTIRANSSRFPERQIQQGEQYFYPQDRIEPFDRDAAIQSPAIQTFLDPNSWIAPSTSPQIADAIRDQLSEHRVSLGLASVGISDEDSQLKVTINLDNPNTIVSLAMANPANASIAQPFANFIRENDGAIIASGTYGAGNWPLRDRGRFVGGTEQFRAYSTGTVLGIRRDNVPEMITIRKESSPPWEDYWFALTAGPRLLKEGQVLPWLPREEGFGDPNITDIERDDLGRAAIGFSADRTKMYHVIFKRGISLRQVAEEMKKIGCSEAMNLEGASRRSLAHNGRKLFPAGNPTNQTHAIVVYDIDRPAPAEVQAAWEAF